MTQLFYGETSTIAGLPSDITRWNAVRKIDIILWLKILDDNYVK